MGMVLWVLVVGMLVGVMMEFGVVEILVCMIVDKLGD